MKNKKGGRPKNPYKVVKRSIPEPAIADFEIWLANWKKENK